jgi:hypothetical protein
MADWSREEVEATVSDYFEMLAAELRGESFNKAEHNRGLQMLLNGRSKGSIEKKHQNISAILIELGYPYIDGYKPLKNYQQLLYSIVEDRLVFNRDLRHAAATAVHKPIVHVPQVDEILNILVDPPRREEDKPVFYDRPVQVRKAAARNYLEIESRNQTLGLAGEKLILEFEQKRLWRSGRKDLANRIRHVAETDGDAVGFDILSYEIDGRERPIEVKTTQFGELTPFFASKNEVDVSDAREADYHLYRLFKFTRQPKLFILPGSLRKTCTLDAVQFSALPR